MLRNTDQPAAAASFAATKARLMPELHEIISRYPQSRSALLTLAHRFQDEEGFVSHEALEVIAELLDLPLAIVESTVSFYTLFYRKPVGKYMLQVCRNLSCTLNGADAVMAHFREKLGVGHLESTDDGIFSYEEVECLAACDRAPCMQVNLESVFDLTPESVDVMLNDMRAGVYDKTKPLPQTLKPARSWKLAYNEPRSAGAQHVPDADSPGGLDKTGYAAAASLQDPSVASRSSERLSKENPPPPSTNGSHH